MIDELSYLFGMLGGVLFCVILDILREINKLLNKK